MSVAATVEVSGGNDVVACFCQINDGVENGRGPGRVSQSRHFVCAFEKTDALFEHIGGGIHKAGVDITQFLECE